MADDSPHEGRPALALTITVSNQLAFVPTLEALAARISEYVGCPASDARHLGEAVGCALTAASTLPADAPIGRFDIVFSGNDRVLRVELASTSSLPAGVTLEGALGGAVGVDRLRQLVDRVEFAEAGGRPVCCLTRQIRDVR